MANNPPFSNDNTSPSSNLPNLESPSENLKTKPENDEFWNKIGFHKTMAGYWYNIILTILEMLLGLIMSGVFLSYLWPFPESQGYSGVVGSLFGLIYQIFDIGTASTMERFVAEARIKDIRKMVKYVQWFIWYQSITGLMQVTILSIYSIYFATQTDLAYLTILMLISLIGQFPGYTGVFKATLDSLQIYDKSAMLGFVQGQVVGRLTEVGFLIYFKYYGINHPAMGEMLGIAIGSQVGGYVSSLISLALSTLFFSRALKAQGITVRDCFRHEFDWPLIREVLIFAIKTGLPGVIFGSLNYTIFLMNLAYIPQYTTMSRLVGMASTLLWVMGRTAGASTSLYAESYLNGKKRLVQFYLSQSWRFIFQMMFFLTSILAAVYFILDDAFAALNILYYNAIFPFLFPVVATYFINAFFSQAEPIIIGSNRPMVSFVIGFIWTIANMALSYILLVVLRVAYMGMNGIIFYLVFKDMILTIIFGTVKYIYINKKIIPISFPYWQGLVATALSCLVSFGIEYGLTMTLYQYLYSNFGFIVAIFPMFIIYLLCGIPVYFSINAFLGGYDSETLEYLRLSVDQSGPSKFLVRFIYHLTEKIAPKSPFFNKYPIPYEQARKEMAELYELKQSQNYKKYSE